MKFSSPFCTTFCLSVLAGAFPAGAQGTFQNLNFEAANISGYPPNSMNIPGTNAFPGWLGNNFWYDVISGGGSGISIMDTNNGLGFGVLQGRYSAYLFGGVGGSVTLSQDGQVPVGTESMRALISWYQLPPVVTVGGQTVTLVPLQVHSNFTFYGADVSAFAGQAVQLSFTETPPSGTPPDWAIIDDIFFSSQPIPEPGAPSLLGLGAVFLGRRFRHTKE